MAKKKIVKQGDIYMVCFGDTVGSEQSGVRPCLIIQNDWGNECSPTTIILPITSKNKNILPTHYVLKKKDYPSLSFEYNIVLAEQIRCIDKKRLERKICTITKEDIIKIIEIINKNFILAD